MAPSRAPTLRLPEDAHNALRLYAFLNDVSLNEAIVNAVRRFLLAQGDNQFEHALDRFRTQYRVALDKLAE